LVLMALPGRQERHRRLSRAFLDLRNEDFSPVAVAERSPDGSQIDQSRWRDLERADIWMAAGEVATACATSLGRFAAERPIPKKHRGIFAREPALETLRQMVVAGTPAYYIAARGCRGWDSQFGSQRGGVSRQFRRISQFRRRPATRPVAVWRKSKQQLVPRSWRGMFATWLDRVRMGTGKDLRAELQWHTRE